MHLVGNNPGPEMKAAFDRACGVPGVDFYEWQDFDSGSRREFAYTFKSRVFALGVKLDGMNDVEAAAEGGRMAKARIG